MSLKTSVEAPWISLRIFAESIPHVLHWDLAYLWVLERQTAMRPAEWAARLDVWRRLVELLLLGELETEVVSVPEPLSRYVSRIDLRDMTVCRLKGRADLGPIGVLSPTVLIRPMPDCDAERLLLELPNRRQERSSELTYFLGQATRALEQAEGELGREVAGVLRREIALAAAAPESTAAAQAASGLGNEVVSVRLLTRVNDRTWEAPQYTGIQLMVAGPGPGRQFVPRCAVCRLSLTRRTTDAAVEVHGDRVTLLCPQGHATDFPLDSFFLWREGESVHAWTDRGITFGSGAQPPPPAAHVEGHAVAFEWPAAQAGEIGRTSLRLSFPGATVRPLSFAREVIFDTLLVPGEFASFSGLPFRTEWWRAVRKKPAVEAQDSEVRYRGIGLRGIPFEFDYTYGPMAIRHEAGVDIGVLPDRMHREWRRYRAFLAGPAAGNYQLAGPGLVPKLPTVAESTTGWPEIVGVQTPDRATGASWATELDVPAPRETPGRPNLYLGLDFGTAYSLLYWATDATRDSPACFALSDLTSSCRMLAGSTGRCFFLPGREPANPHLLPSALWEFHDQDFTPLRWNGLPYGLTATALHGFKWDSTHAGQYDAEREGYLEELLFLTAPAVLSRAGMRGCVPAVHIGLAYPLAFAHDSINRFKKSLERVTKRVEQWSGSACHVYSLNESHACARAFGRQNPGETFLIADMGGGTLDVALFTITPDREADYHQLGSVRFGGETFLQRLAERTAAGGSERQYWVLRSAIAAGTVGQALPNDPNVQRMLSRFLPIALEFLRTMVAAFRQARPSQKICVLPAGNGWRLCELVTGGALSPARALRDYLGPKLRLFEQPGLELYDADLGVPSSKHLVAMGALKNALGDRLDALERESQPAKLPAGRKVSFREGEAVFLEIEWHRLVGQGAPEPPPLPAVRLRHASIDFGFAEGPPVPTGWKTWLDQAIGEGNPYPSQAGFQDLFQKLITDSGLERGPLQVILESHWSKQI